VHATEIDGGTCHQAMVPMRDGVRLNTFVYLPGDGRGTYPVILFRTPYGITTTPGQDMTDPAAGWLPSDEMPMFGPLLRGWRSLIAKQYAVVYQDCRGRFGSQGLDRVYGADAADGYDTLEWIAAQPWSNGTAGLAGSSGAAITAYAAASQRHPSVKAMFAQVGSADIYQDVIYEGGSIEMERLWLWVAGNVPGLSQAHRDTVLETKGITAQQFAAAAATTAERALSMQEAQTATPPFVGSPAWTHLPLAGDPDFSTCQPYFDEIITHPLPDDFRRAHDFRSTIDIPAFHATTWYDTFLNSVIKTYEVLQERVGNQRLWIGPGAHSAIYEDTFWPRDPFFEWFDYWLMGVESPLINEPPVYYSQHSWTGGRDVSGEWITAGQWPPLQTVAQELHLNADGSLDHTPKAGTRSYRYDPRHPVPTHGGRNLIITAGLEDQRAARLLPDYGLVYQSEDVPAGFDVLGRVVARLSVESDCPDTDFVVKLIDVHPDGRALLVADGMVRALTRDGEGPQPLQPGEVVDIDVDLGTVCHTFGAGHRVAVDVTSSNFPRRIRNTNSGHLSTAHDTDEDIRVAVNTVHHGERFPSRLILPVTHKE
jgi:uncharacterized protein